MRSAQKQTGPTDYSDDPACFTYPSKHLPKHLQEMFTFPHSSFSDSPTPGDPALNYAHRFLGQVFVSALALEVVTYRLQRLRAIGDLVHPVLDLIKGKHTCSHCQLPILDGIARTVFSTRWDRRRGYEYMKDPRPSSPSSPSQRDRRDRKDRQSPHREYCGRRLSSACSSSTWTVRCSSSPEDLSWSLRRRGWTKTAECPYSYRLRCQRRYR